MPGAGRIRLRVAGVVVVMLCAAGGVRGQERIVVSSNHLAQAIPAVGDGEGWMVPAELTVTEAVTIWDIDVYLDIEHGYAADLEILLTGPGGRKVVLKKVWEIPWHVPEQPLAGTVVFDDEAAGEMIEGEPPFAGRFQPVEPLSTFDGQGATGVWKLEIYDAYLGHAGVLHGWGLEIEPGHVPEPTTGVMAMLSVFLMRIRLRRLRERGGFGGAGGRGLGA